MACARQVCLLVCVVDDVYLVHLIPHLNQLGIDASCKTSFVVALLRLLVPKGHKVLLFSQNTRMLDILQAAVEQEGYQWLRIDGSVTSAAEREVGCPCVLDACLQQLCTY